MLSADFRNVPCSIVRIIYRSSICTTALSTGLYVPQPQLYQLPTHIELNAALYDMDKDSVVLLEQLRTIDKKRLKDKVCHLDGEINQRFLHL